MNWYVLQNGQQKGPFTDEKIKQMVFAHQLQREDLVWNDTLPQWVEAGSIRDFFAPGDPLPVSQNRRILPADKINRQRKPGYVMVVSLFVSFVCRIMARAGPSVKAGCAAQTFQA